MGWIRHHGIVVTSWDKDLIEKAHWEARERFDAVTEIVDSGINYYRTFLIPPDGSKEGWDDSDAGDARRADYIAWLRSLAHEDGSSSIDWLEYQHDTDNRDARVTTFSGASVNSTAP
jgi:hypothetical protein